MNSSRAHRGILRVIPSAEMEALVGQTAIDSRVRTLPHYRLFWNVFFSAALLLLF